MAYVGVKPAAITSATQAEIAGDLTVDTNTLKVDATNNRVGVGTLTPADHLAVVASGANAHISVDRSDGATGRTVLIHSSSGGQLQTTGSAPLIFGTADTERGRFLAGGGLTFNGDTAAANALDDYEESTYNFAERNGQATITTHRCRVVKIGAMVYIDGSFTVGSNSNGNALNINLPFASTIGTNGLGGGSIGFSNISATIIEANLRPNVENLADNLFFRYGQNNLVSCSDASGKRIDFNVWYPVL